MYKKIITHLKKCLSVGICTVYLFSLIQCNSSKKESTQEKAPLTIGGLYHFAQTEDTSFCNSELIIGSDCAGGDLYFSKQHTVIFQFYCQGQDSVSYDLGTYSLSDSTILWEFTHSFTYAYNEMDSLQLEIHQGVFQTIKTKSKVLVKPIVCSEFPFYFNLTGESDGTYCYVLKTADTISSQLFLSNMEKIKAFQTYLKK
jgi:hypothetical protein